LGFNKNKIGKMGYQISAIALAPILFLQGKFVRKTTPQLPEAKGEQKGHQRKWEEIFKTYGLRRFSSSGSGSS